MADITPFTPLAADSRSLDALRNQASRDPQKAIRAAAGQFESLFMRQLLKNMRDAMPKSGMWDSPGQSMYQDMFDQQMAQAMSSRPGGLADVIARQLSRSVKGGVAVPAQGATAPDATGASGLFDVTGSSGSPGSPGASGSSGSPGSPGARSAWGADARAQGVGAAIRRAAGASAPATSAPATSAPTTGAPTAPAARAMALPAADASAMSASMPPARAMALPMADAAARAPSMPDTSRLNPVQADFVRRVWPHAVMAQQATGVPAEYIVGQAALESGWGRHEIRNANGSGSFNLFGIKAGSAWTGDVAKTTTTEFVAGQPAKQVAKFRSYGSYAQAFSDWATLMSSSPRYAQALKSADGAHGFASGLQKAGYATDPQYGAKLERTINQTLMLRRLVT